MLTFSVAISQDIDGHKTPRVKVWLNVPSPTTLFVRPVVSTIVLESQVVETCGNIRPLGGERRGKPSLPLHPKLGR